MATHPVAHLLTCSLAHLLTCSLAHLLTHLLACLLPQAAAVERLQGLGFDQEAVLQASQVKSRI